MEQTPIKIEYDQLTAMELIQLLITGKLNPDPIAQRGPTSAGYKKSIKIIDSFTKGHGLGMILIRDIRNNPIAKAIYECDYLVIDGGHRCRALRAFYEGRFPVNGKTFAMFEDLDLNSIKIPVAYYTCSSTQAAHVFRAINTTTPTNFMEMVMANEESSAAKTVRSIASHVKEYKNEVHPLWELGVNKFGEVYCQHFDGNLPNPRAKWYEWVAIAIIRSIAKGNVDAGQTEIENLIDGDPEITAKALIRTRKFLDSCVALRKFRGRKFNADIFSAYMVFYFDVLEQGSFKIVNENEFFGRFMHAYSMLTGTNDTTYEEETTTFEKVREFVKPFVRKNIKNWSNSAAQKHVAMLFREVIGDAELGIIRLHPQRSLTANQREEKLYVSGGVCAIDGLPLLYSDAVYAHDTPWSKGGETSFNEGAMVRACHNRDMGTMTLAEYKFMLQAQGKLAS